MLVKAKSTEEDNLIAPVKIGNNVKIGAGSVINKDIPNIKLAIRRSNLKIY